MAKYLQPAVPISPTPLVCNESAEQKIHADRAVVWPAPTGVELLVGADVVSPLPMVSLSERPRRNVARNKICILRR